MRLANQDLFALPIRQIYYGHRQRSYLANDSGIPTAFWRDHPNAETRGFYCVLNERTRLYMAAFGLSKDA